MPNKSFKNTWLGTTTIKNDQNDLGTQITDNWNQTVKLTGDQTISGTKTFNNLKTAQNFDLSGSDWNFDNKDVGFKQIRKLWLGGPIEMGGNKIENLGAPANNNDAARKAYVDSRTPQFTELLTWTGNLATTDLTFSKASSFSSTGIYDFVIQMKYLGKVFNHSLTMNLDSFGKDNISGVWHFVNNTTSNSIANLNTLTTAFSLLITTGKAVKIIRYGTQHNATDSSIKIMFRKRQ